MVDSRLKKPLLTLLVALLTPSFQFGCSPSVMGLTSLGHGTDGTVGTSTPAEESDLPPVVGDPISFTDVGDVFLTVHWGPATDPETSASLLQYKVVKASLADQINSVEKAERVSLNDLVMDWTPDTSSYSVNGLTNGTVYFFAVLVKDPAGHKSIYSSQRIETLDSEIPTVGEISFDSIAPTSLTVNWSTAVDNVTLPFLLRYKLVKAWSPEAINTLDDADQIQGADLVMDWTANVLSAPVTGLTSGTTYFFSVLVEDEAGNRAVYPVRSASTDLVPPTLGLGISFSSRAANSVTVNWGAATDDVTPSQNLEYKVVMALDPNAIGSIENAQSITTPGLVMDWTANISTFNAQNLSSDTTYYFTVLVRDAAGNITRYAPAQVSTDILPPTIETDISFTSLTASSVSVNWGAATDNVTDSSSLLYKVVKGASEDDINTATKANLITTGDANLILDWTVNTLSQTVSGLTDSTTYFFAVLVKDAADNINFYPPQSVTTLDTTVPIIGTGITFPSVTATSVTVNWGAATDNVTSQSSLQYKLVRTSNNTTTVSEADAITGANPNLMMDWSTGTLSQTVSGLSTNTTYFFAVLVKDAAGNLSLYAPQSVTTLDSTPPVPGSAITFSSVSTTSLTVNWDAASDNITPQALLQYRLVKGATTAIDMTAASNLTSSDPNLVMDWTAGTLTQAVTGLTSNTSVAFAVLVKDSSGNIAMYTPKSVTTYASGALDPSYGTAGRRANVLGVKNDNLNQLVVQPLDGKIVAVGPSADAGATTFYFGVTRNNVDGSLDTTFGSGGIVQTQVGIDSAFAQAVALQSDGKILVGGYGRQVSGNYDFALVRYTTYGAVDTSFGNNGIVLTDLGSTSDEIMGIAVQDDGKIVVAGWSGLNIAYARYFSSGFLDTGFAGGGKVVSGYTGISYGIALQKLDQLNQKILLVGELQVAAGNYDFAVIRLGTSGAVDSSFGASGVASAGLGSHDSARTIAVQGDGKIIVGGLTTSPSDMAIMRFTANGLLDTSFGGGIVTRNYGSNDIVYSVAVQSDGKILALGNGTKPTLLRYNTDGTLDLSFGTSGEVFNSTANSATSLAVQSDGKIIMGCQYVGSGTGSDFQISRYFP